MKFRVYLLSLAAAGAILAGCRDNNMPSDMPDNKEVNKVSVPQIEFSEPALIIVQGEESGYRISNPKSLEPFILRANTLSLEIAVVPPADLTFRLKDGKSRMLNSESLSDGQLIFFNGKELLLTSAGDAETGVFDAFYGGISASGTEDGPGTNVAGSGNVAGKHRWLKDQAGRKGSRSPGNANDNSSKESGDAYPGYNIKSTETAGIRPIPSAYTASVQSEPVKYPLYPVIVRNPEIESLIWPYSGFEMLLDNDLFSNTDRYYTNGVQLKYRSPSIAFWRINSILPVNMKKSMEYNSLELHHAMYTPFTTKVPPLLEDDRPYAATLYLKFSRRSDSPEKGISQRASFDIGVIGEAALGSYLQKGVHAGLPTNDEPLGWETQIGNDLVVNYNYELIKEFVSAGPFSAYSVWTGSLGTLNTSAGTGIGIKLGNDNYLIAPLPGSFADLQKIRGNRWRYSFESGFTTRVVGYNATLTGGILNKKNIYVLKPQEIERLLFIANAGLRMKYGRYGISIAQYYLSNEFKEGKSHFWGQIGIDIGF